MLHYSESYDSIIAHKSEQRRLGGTRYQMKIELWELLQHESSMNNEEKIKKFREYFGFKTPDEYNIAESTATNYKRASKYQAIRYDPSIIDHEYHGYYKEDRIALQDEICDLFLNDPEHAASKWGDDEQRWLIFLGLWSIHQAQSMRLFAFSVVGGGQMTFQS